MSDQHHHLDESDINHAVYHNHKLANNEDEVIDLMNELPPEKVRSKSR